MSASAGRRASRAPNKCRILLHCRRNVAPQRGPPTRRLRRRARLSLSLLARLTLARLLLRRRHLRHTHAKPMHLALDDLFLSPQRALIAPDAPMAHLARLRRSLFQLRQGVCQAVERRGQLVAAAARLPGFFSDAGRGGDARDKRRVLHQPLVALGRQEGVGEGGGRVRPERLERREGVHGAAEARLAEGARGGLLEPRREGSHDGVVTGG